MTTVQFRDDRLVVPFESFDLVSYELFLRVKRLPEYELAYDPERETYTVSAPARFAALLGVERLAAEAVNLPLSDFLFDDQKYTVTIALDAKRFAVWSGCGLGKTLVELEFARHVLHRTGGRVLLVTLNEIVPQFLSEAARFYPEMDLLRLGSQAEMIDWCRSGLPGIALTNYEKFNPKALDSGVINECRYLSGIIIDENRIKGGGGSKQKKVLNASCKGIEYKLSCTATPAPNETIEFAAQATFLEKIRTEEDILWTYFVRDSKTHRRTVRPYARAAFFDFMSSWSIYLQNPQRFGWRLDLPAVPPPQFFEHELEPTPEQSTLARTVLADALGTGSLFLDRETNAIERLKLAQLARGFLYRRRRGEKARRVERVPSRKPGYIADLIRAEVDNGHQVLVWTVFDEESTILRELVGDSVPHDLLVGATAAAERLAILERFRVGGTRCLISRARLLGFGMNFQHCTSMIFSGFSDSFEDLYQAIRRAVRYGQEHAVRVHFPLIPELEGESFANLKRKAAEHERACAEMEDNYLRSYRKLSLGVA